MERLTKKIDRCTVFPEELVGVTLVPDNPIMGKLLLRLAAYEDTGYTPEEIAKLQGDLIQRNAELLKTREELKEHYDSISQLDGANSSLMAANEKLAADRKALINELCQYCGKYKQAHEGACDGCRWREM